MFGMPGIPCVYYGSEWGTRGEKKEGDPSLRPYFAEPVENGMTEWVALLAEAKKGSKALNYGNFTTHVLTNKQCIFERAVDGERVLVAINADEASFRANFQVGTSKAVDLISGEEQYFDGGVELPGYTAYLWKV
jgi:glycosidase